MLRFRFVQRCCVSTRNVHTFSYITQTEVELRGPLTKEQHAAKEYTELVSSRKADVEFFTSFLEFCKTTDRHELLSRVWSDIKDLQLVPNKTLLHKLNRLASNPIVLYEMFVKAEELNITVRRHKSTHKYS
jgi:hypothetical protein